MTKRRHSTSELESTVAAAVTAALATATAKAAAVAAAVAVAREKECTCGICLALLDKPTTLSCGHTHCLKCIQKWLRQKEECPVCRRGVSRMQPLSVNLVIQNVIVDNAGPLYIERKEIEAKTKIFYTALHKGDPIAAIATLSPGIDLNLFVGDVNEQEQMWTPLLWCCALAKDENVEEWNDLIDLLLNEGADAQARDYSGRNALYHATESNHQTTFITTMPVLLERGVFDPSVVSRISNMLWSRADTAVCITLDTLLLQMVKDVSYSRLPFSHKLLDLSQLLKSGFDRTAVGLFEQYIFLAHQHVTVPQCDMLYWAASGGCALFIHKVLNARYATVNHLFVNNQTALHIACLFNKQNAALALIERGAILFHPDDFRRTPYESAVLNGMTLVVEALEAKGCTC